MNESRETSVSKSIALNRYIYLHLRCNYLSFSRDNAMRGWSEIWLHFVFIISSVLCLLRFPPRTSQNVFLSFGERMYSLSRFVTWLRSAHSAIDKFQIIILRARNPVRNREKKSLQQICNNGKASSTNLFCG